jgi:outer membrane protein
MRVILIFLLYFLHLPVSADNIKIGFIDTQQVIVNLSKYKNGVERIALEFEPKKRELLDLFNHIELLRENIDLNPQTDSSDSLEIKLSKLADLEESFEQETEFWQNAINNEKVYLLKNIETLINESIRAFAIEEDYDFILYDNVAFVSDQANITQLIIEKIEKYSP